MKLNFVLIVLFYQNERNLGLKVNLYIHIFCLLTFRNQLFSLILGRLQATLQTSDQLGKMELTGLFLGSGDQVGTREGGGDKKREKGISQQCFVHELGYQIAQPPQQ